MDAIRLELAEIAAECEGLMGEKDVLAQQLQRVLTGSRCHASQPHTLPHLQSLLTP